MRVSLCAATVGMIAAGAVAAGSPVATPSTAAHVLFVEPDGATPGGELPLYREVTEPRRLAGLSRWLDNEAGRWALDLYGRARAIASAHGASVQPPEYIIALVPDRNNAAVGLRLRTPAGIENHPRVAFIQLGPEEWRFSIAMLHETGHVVLAMLAGGTQIPKREIAAIPHAVAAVTDRGTAFDEGFAISLETLLAHLSGSPDVRRRYRHEQFLFGPAAKMHAEYYGPSAELLTFAQTVARYAEVRDNAFAFAPAFTGPDYLRAQMEKARDFANLRDADQLLASEGFHASFFFSLLMRGERLPGDDSIRAREDAVMTGLAEAFGRTAPSPESPFLLQFLEAYGWLHPAEWAEILDVFLDLSRGVFVDGDAAAMWRAHYLAALSLDIAHLGRERIDGAREHWRGAIMANPKVLYSRLGPQLRCEVSERTVRLVGMESERPLSFDVNTAEEGVMRLVPAITEAEVASWLAQRVKAPFASVDDFRKRSGLSEKALAALKF